MSYSFSGAIHVGFITSWTRLGALHLWFG